MRISDIQVSIVKGNFDWVIIAVHTSNGLVGIGEGFAGVGVKEMVLKLKNTLIGEDPTEINKLYIKMYNFWLAHGFIASAGIGAVSGIEAALWDILGKYYKAPIYKLIGGKLRDRIKVYADCHAGEGKIKDHGFYKLEGEFTPEAFAEKAKKVKDKGFKALKFDIDLPLEYRPEPYSRITSYEELKHIEKLISVLRDVVGENFDLAVDCHWRFDVSDAVKLSRILEPYNLVWIEDPLPPENIDALAKVTRKSKVPICVGEHYFTRHGFREILIKQAADIIGLDVQKVGGIIEAVRVADMASTYYVTIAPHNLSSPIGTFASVHVCAVIPNFHSLEFHSESLEWWDDIVKASKPIIKDGYIEVPSKAGLGIEPNLDVIKEHLAEGEKMFDY
jgi:galactonate dehydratase